MRLKAAFPHLARLLPALLLFFLAGCADWQTSTPVPLPQPRPDWKTLSGQLRYSDGKRSVIGDVIIRWSSPEQSLVMEFSKGGAPLMKVARTADHAWTTGVLARHNFQGYFANLPASMQGWVYAPIHEVNVRARDDHRLFDPGMGFFQKPWTGGKETFVFQLGQ